MSSTKTNTRFPIPVFILAIYTLLALSLIVAGSWLVDDLIASRTSILTERTALALQTSRLMSQQFGTTILISDYVLRDLTTRTTPQELDLADVDPKVEQRLSLLAKQKMATLPNVMGIGFLDRRAVFVAAADRHLIGIKSNSSLLRSPGQVLEDRAYVDYVPINKSANKQPALLVSRAILSPSGRMEGGALAAISLSSAQSWIETFNIGPYDTIALLDEQSTLLASNPPKLQLIGTELKCPPEKPILEEQRDSASFVSISPMDGRERIYGLSKVANIPLTILVGLDKERVLHEWQQRVKLFLIGAIILLILLGIVVSMQLKTLRQQGQLQEMAITDPLTGIANRRHLTTTGTKEIAKAARYRNSASLLMVDIDHFKVINDTYGHPCGDRVIQAVATTMAQTIRTTDEVGRIGGEEFVAVLPGTDAQGALILANRLRELIEISNSVTSDEGIPIRFTISVGVACVSDETTTFEQVLAKADQALYEAKNRGRNTVVLSALS